MSTDTILDVAIAIAVLGSVFGASHLKKLAGKIRRALSHRKQDAKTA